MAKPSPPAHSRCTPFAGKCSLDQGGEGHATHAQLRDTTNMLVCQCLITARLHKQRQLFIHMAKPSPPAHSRCTPFAGKCSLDQGREGHVTIHAKKIHPVNEHDSMVEGEGCIKAKCAIMLAMLAPFSKMLWILLHWQSCSFPTL